MDGLVPGRCVYYVMGDQDAVAINRRRTTGQSIAARLATDPPSWPAGAQAHIGNAVTAGDILPATVIRIWGSDSGCSNLREHLDGNDDYWATSRSYNQNKVPATWHWPDRPFV